MPSRQGTPFVVRLFSIMLLSVAATAGAQTNADFENGLTGWSATGDAFVGQPLDATTATTTDFVRNTIGGGYWRGLSYPIAQSGLHLIHTSVAGVGTLTSEDFVLSAASPYVAALVGGPNEVNTERLELLVGDLVVWQATGWGPDQMHQEVFQIPQALLGRQARLRIVDSSNTSHINVDRIAFFSAPPAAPHTPVWGLADYHTHPQNYMAFGGLNGIRTVWGVPGGAYRDYELHPELIFRDLPTCDWGHGGGPASELFINGAEGRLPHTLNFKAYLSLLFRGYAFHHGRSGAKSYQDFPSFNTGLHYQMHITQIHRAWEGGLRLMTAIAIHNKGVEFFVAKVVDGQTAQSSERDVIDAQVCGMRQMASLNHEWMEIAYSPAQARDIIMHGKLAVILGAEFDELGQLTGFDNFADEVEYLWEIGIRQITPVHAVDNLLGGASVFEPAYNWLNDLLNRPKFNMSASEATAADPIFFNVENSRCGQAGSDGECSSYRLDIKQNQPAIQAGKVPFFVTKEVSQYANKDGMKNQRGLMPAGALYIRQLMNHGMIIGLEHMSEHTVSGVHDLVGQILAENGHPECRDLPRAGPSCNDLAYPLSVSHAHFRRLSPATSQEEGYRPTEYEVGDSQLRIVQRTGGIIGQFTGEDPLKLPDDVPSPGVLNDCGGSTKSMALSLTYALRGMQNTGVGLATDYTIITATAPRFGKYACWSARPNLTTTPNDTPFADQYNVGKDEHGIERQKNPVIYSGTDRARLEPYRIGKRTYDFNVDGFANYGLMPDLLQDLQNIGLAPTAFQSLFSSAEAYITSWEKAERLSGRTFGSFVPRELPCEIACRGLCPLSPNAGAPGH